MVAYHPPAVKSVPIQDAVNHISRVSADSAGVVAARALGVSFGEYPPNTSPVVKSLRSKEKPARPGSAASLRSA